MAFGLVLLWASWGIIREVSQILLQAVPKKLDMPDVVAVVRTLEGVCDVHHTHAWALTLGKNIVSMRVQVDRMSRAQGLAKADSRAAADAVRRLLLDRADRNRMRRPG